MISNLSLNEVETTVSFVAPVIHFKKILDLRNENKSKRLINFKKLNLYDFLLCIFCFFFFSYFSFLKTVRKFFGKEKNVLNNFFVGIFYFFSFFLLFDPSFEFLFKKNNIHDLSNERKDFKITNKTFSLSALRSFS